MDPIKIGEWIVGTLGPHALLWSVICGILGFVAWVMWRRNVTINDGRLSDFNRTLDVLIKSSEAQKDLATSLEKMADALRENSDIVREERDRKASPGRWRR